MRKRFSDVWDVWVVGVILLVLLFIPTMGMWNSVTERDESSLVTPQETWNVLLGKSYAAETVIEIEVTNQAGGATNTLYLFGMLY